MTTFHYERTKVLSRDLVPALNEHGARGWRTVYLRPSDDGSEFDLIVERETAGPAVRPVDQLRSDPDPSLVDRAARLRDGDAAVAKLLAEQDTDGKRVHGY